MKKIFILFIILTSCNITSNTVSTQKDKEQSVVKTEENKLVLNDEFEIDYTLIDNEFAGNPFGFEKTAYATLKALNPIKIESKPQANRHVKGQVDTLYTFHFEKSRVEIYKLHDRQFVVSAKIRDNDIILKDDIKIGMTKKSFLNKFPKMKNSTSSDRTFRIKTFEVEQWVDFEFIDDKLVQMIFTGYLD